MYYPETFNGSWSTGGSIVGVRYKTKSYQMWSDMVKRVKQDNLYSGVEIKFKDYQDFADFINNEFGFLVKHKGAYWEVDKDLSGYRCYSRDSCILVPKYINYFFLSPKRKGLCMRGVHYRSGKFKSEIKDGSGRKKFLGSFETEYEAHQAWREEKLKMLNNYIEHFSNVKHNRLVLFLCRIKSNILEDMSLGLPSEDILRR